MDEPAAESKKEQIQRDFDALIVHAQEQPELSPRWFQEALEQLKMAIEELQVAEEKFRTQNVELAESRLRSEADSARYRDLFEFAPDGYLVTSLTGDITEANMAASAMLNVRVDFLIGKPLGMFVGEDDRTTFAKALEAAARTGKTKQFELDVQPRGGRTLPAAVTAAPVIERGEVSDLRWLVKDISRTRSVESELKRSNLDLDRYARTVSHDLQGPIASILLGTRFLKDSVGRIADDELRGEIEESGRAIEDNATTAYALVEDLLKLAEPARSDLEAGKVDVGSVVEQILRERSVHLKKRDFVVNVDPELGGVWASRVHVYQVFSNLIDNALKYDDNPKPVILISFLGKDEEGGSRYSVSDNGHGISDEVLGKLSSGTLGRESGPGTMGLSIVSRVVATYGGNLSASNDGGAHVEFSLRDASPAGVPTGNDKAGAAAHVLIVEDEPGTAYALSTLLKRKLSASSETAESLADAREDLSNGTFDLVTLDYKLPDGTGLELLAEIATMDDPPPVVLVTGHSEEIAENQAYSLGASGYVVKDKDLGSRLPEAAARAIRDRPAEKGITKPDAIPPA